MFWYLQMSGVVKDSTLHHDSKGSCKTRHCNTAENPGIICDEYEIQNLFAGIDTTGFGHGPSSYYYTKRIKLRRKFVKLSICADMKEQLICAIKIRQ